MRQERLLFEYWQRYKRAEVNWKAFRRLASPVRKEFNSLLLRCSYSGNAKLIGFCDEILPPKDHLLTFLDVEGIEPTNYAAERALRSAVILRKLSFGTQSNRGSRYLERILSVSETSRLQKRNAYEYLIAVMKAKFSGETAPSLLPLIEDHAAVA
jgi:transposase